MTNQHETYRWLVERLPGERPLRLLDLGCGECLEAEALLAAGVDVTGLDIDEAAVDSAQARVANATFACEDASAARRGEEFDVVLLRRPDLAAQPDRWQRVFLSVRQSLGAAGQIMVTTPGRREADLACRWLEQSGFGTATGPAAANAQTHVTSPLVRVWDDIGEEPAELCDLKTGHCGPLRGSTLEDDDAG
ncbi:MAG TPA: methyltransferase domain-containing protein [Vicinamibacterales bacterium]|jgi:SAM-dependent methyltransferase